MSRWPWKKRRQPIKVIRLTHDAVAADVAANYPGLTIDEAAAVIVRSLARDTEAARRWSEASRERARALEAEVELERLRAQMAEEDS